MRFSVVCATRKSSTNNCRPTAKSRPDGAAVPGPGASPEAAKGPSKNHQREVARREKAVEDAEAALAVVEDELAAPERWATQYESAKSQARHTAAKRAVEQAYAALEELEEKATA